MTLAAGFKTKMDWFAELLAEGLSVPDAGRIMGLKNPVRDGNTYLQRLRRSLGEQAR